VGDGLAITMEVSGLAPNPPGSVYECWYVGPGDSLERPNRVSAGTFTVGADGRASLRLHSAADLQRYPAMGVTLERDRGNRPAAVTRCWSPSGGLNLPGEPTRIAGQMG
jgi:hypothetical protein